MLQLAADLQAVADDLPLPCTASPGEAVRSRGFVVVVVGSRRWERFCSCSRRCLPAAWVCAEQSNLLRQAVAEYGMGEESLERNVFFAAKAHFDTAENLAAASELSPWRYLEKAGRIRQIGPTLTSRISKYQERTQTAGAHRAGTGEVEGGGCKERKQKEADALFEAADRLRFQLLLDEGSDLTQATTELQVVLAPFFVLENEDWTKLEHMMILLHADRRKRIVNDVSELLFLWMAAIDESAADSPRATCKNEKSCSRPQWRPARRRCVGRAQGTVAGPSGGPACPERGLRSRSGRPDRTRGAAPAERAAPCQYREIGTRVFSVGHSRLPGRPAGGARSSGWSGPAGSRKAATTGTSSCSATSKTRTDEQTTLSAITRSHVH